MSTVAAIAHINPAAIAEKPRNTTHTTRTPWRGEGTAPANAKAMNQQQDITPPPMGSQPNRSSSSPIRNTAGGGMAAGR